MSCRCETWGRDNLGAILHLEHHPNCEHYRPEPEVRELLQRLIDGIESWASDEDGVHPDCWDAYVSACGACGQWDRPKASDDDHGIVARIDTDGRDVTELPGLWDETDRVREKRQ